MYKNKKILAISLTLLCLGLLFSATPTTNNNPKNIIPPSPSTRLIISSWTFPSDAYGQGISGIHIYENSSGSWLDHLPYQGASYAYIDATDTVYIEYNMSSYLKLQYFSYFNSTKVGVATTTEGKNYLRHNISIVDYNNTVVFSQQNFTYLTVSTLHDPIWIYSYTVILNFVPTMGSIYTATMIYEVYH